MSSPWTGRDATPTRSGASPTSRPDSSRSPGGTAPGRTRTCSAPLRSADGERLALQGNVFVDVVLQAGTLRTLTPQEVAAYRAPFARSGEDRRAVLAWARQIPIDGHPARVHRTVEAGAAFMAASGVPKLLVRGESGAVVTGAVLAQLRAWPHQQEVVVPGTHFLPHDSPREIAAALRDWLATTVGP